MNSQTQPMSSLPLAGPDTVLYMIYKMAHSVQRYSITALQLHTRPQKQPTAPTFRSADHDRVNTVCCCAPPAT
jgi:hypothetical protein